jgi:peptidoglycan hydrolase-like protein with peptidoglycan-binding domain
MQQQTVFESQAFEGDSEFDELTEMFGDELEDTEEEAWELGDSQASGGGELSDEDEDMEEERRRASRSGRAGFRPRARRRPKPRPSRSPRRRRAPWATGVALAEPLGGRAVQQRSEYVRWVQSSLNQLLGLRLPVTGVMDAASRSALRRFQSQQGLTADGIAGPETRKALVEAKTKSKAPTSPSPGEPPDQQPPEPPSGNGAATPAADQELVDWARRIFGGGTAQRPPAVARKGVAIAARRAATAARKKAFPGMPPEKVCWIQNVLNKVQAASLAPDGIYGPLTRDAVRKFQAANSLAVDGVMGPRTETALIQAALNQIAKASLVPVNGVMDARTRDEIRRFQTSRRLVVDGVVGPKTRGAMIAALGGKCAIRRVVPPRPPVQPPGPVPPVRPGCDPAVAEGLRRSCTQDYALCLGKCGFNSIIERLKLIPALAPCIRARNPYLVVLCALAKGGFRMIDDLIRVKSCIEDCRRSREFCDLNAQRCTRAAR